MQEQASKSSIDKLLTSIPPSIFNRLPLPINFVDENCRVIVMNQAFLDYIGSSPLSRERLHIFDFYPL